MAVSVTLNTSAAQEARLTILMNRQNVQRIANGLPVYADINDMAKTALIAQLTAWMKELFATESFLVADAFVNANDNVQAQVKALLGI